MKEKFVSITAQVRAKLNSYIVILSFLNTSTFENH